VRVEGRSVHATARSEAPTAGLRVPRTAPRSRPAPRRSPGEVVLRACRPRQWVKNALVAIAPAAAGALTRADVVAHVLGAFVAFCLLASATYLVNDVRDRDQDRRHPRKRHRPIAAGELSPRGALRLAALMVVLGLAVAVAVRPLLGAVAVGYLALTTSYSLWWRHVAIIDIVVVAGGFLLRAIAGAVATGVPPSRSFLVVTSACALFLVAGKRYAELAEGGAHAGARATLRRYSRPLLRGVLWVAAAVGCLAYARWAFTRPGASACFELSIVPFLLWLGRYSALLGAGAGEAPEEVILRDPGLLAAGATWIALFVGGVYVAG
jgi:decaprenyl-phosphate phosphoribosyltransferase